MEFVPCISTVRLFTSGVITEMHSLDIGLLTFLLSSLIYLLGTSTFTASDGSKQTFTLGGLQATHRRDISQACSMHKHLSKEVHLNR